MGIPMGGRAKRKKPRKNSFDHTWLSKDKRRSGHQDHPRAAHQDVRVDFETALIDTIFEYGEIWDGEHRNDLLRAVLPYRYSARRFSVDENASQLASHLRERMRGDPAFESALIEFAMPPFSQTYMEFYGGLLMDDDKRTEGRFAVLTTSPLWFFFATLPGEDGGDARMLTVAWNTETRRWQGARPWVKTILEDSEFKDSMAALIDAVRTLFLLMANRVIRYVDVPASRKIVRGKVRAYAARTEVHIDLGALEQTKARFGISGHRGPVRHHEVRGHFVHYKTGAYCSDHAYVRVENKDPDDQRKRWRCQCGALRVWRTYPDGRGDATKGHVSQRYMVEDSRQEHQL